jgi:transcriptional regulator with XRE-family HTH domain
VSSDPPPEWLLEQERRIGRRIRDVRVWRGLSQEKLAERAGISRYTVYRLELAQASPPIAHLLRIAHALDVHPTVLLEDPGADLSP